MVEWNGLREQRAKGPLSPAVQNVHAINNSMGTQTPFDAFQRLFSCDAVPPKGFNWAGVCDEKLQEMIGEASKTFDRDAQLKLSQRIHEQIVDNAYWLFVVHDVNPRAMSPDVKGFKQAKSWTQDLTQIYVQK